MVYWCKRTNIKLSTGSSTLLCIGAKGSHTHTDTYQIAVDNVVFVQVGDSTEKAPNDASGIQFVVRVARVQIPTIAQFQYQKETFVIRKRFMCLDNVGVVQLFENVD